MQAAVADLHKLGVKIFVADPAVVRLAEFIPVFHGWIRQQKIPGHLLIDVHDYSHVPQGPGILLVGHEGNFSIDQGDGRLGLCYQRKQPLAGDLAARLQAILTAARQAAALLEAEPQLGGIRFPPAELIILANDRLLAPNTAAGRGALEPVVRQTFPGAKISLAPRCADTRERLAFVVGR